MIADTDSRPRSAAQPRPYRARPAKQSGLPRPPRESFRFDPFERRHLGNGPPFGQRGAPKTRENTGQAGPPARVILMPWELGGLFGAVVGSAGARHLVPGRRAAVAEGDDHRARQGQAAAHGPPGRALVPLQDADDAAQQVDRYDGASLSDDGKTIDVKSFRCNDPDDPITVPLASVQARLENLRGMQEHLGTTTPRRSRTSRSPPTTPRRRCTRPICSRRRAWRSGSTTRIARWRPTDRSIRCGSRGGSPRTRSSRTCGGGPRAGAARAEALGDHGGGARQGDRGRSGGPDRGEGVGHERRSGLTRRRSARDLRRGGYAPVPPLPLADGCEGPMGQDLCTRAIARATPPTPAKPPRCCKRWDFGRSRPPGWRSGKRFRASSARVEGRQDHRGDREGRRDRRPAGGTRLTMHVPELAGIMARHVGLRVIFRWVERYRQVRQRRTAQPLGVRAAALTVMGF